MKKVLFTLFYSLMSVMLYGQSFAVSADKMNVAYIGVDNPLTVVAEGYSCSQLIVTCDNGKLTKGAGCDYNFRPDKPGRFDIIVKAKTANGLKQIGIAIYRVKFIPPPIARIAGKSEGMLEVAIFKAQLGVLAHFDGFDFDAQMKVREFKIEFFRNGQILYNDITSGPFFNEATRNQMKNLKAGDKVSVTNIKAAGPDNRMQTLNNICLTLY